MTLPNLDEASLREGDCVTVEIGTVLLPYLVLFVDDAVFSLHRWVVVFSHHRAKMERTVDYVI